jgi:hypothetical protein
MTRLIRQHLEAGCNAEDLIGLMHDKNLWVDDIEAAKIADDRLKQPCEQGYLTVSNALQWSSNTRGQSSRQERCIVDPENWTAR